MENVLKELTINEASYQIVKMPAQTGSWLLMLLMGKLMEVMSEESKTATSKPEEPAKEANADEAASAAISFMLMNLDEETFAKVQQKALSVCFKMVNDAPMPVIMRDGRFAIKELEYDIEGVLQLTSQSIRLNLSPFFAKGKLMGLATAD